MATPMPKTAEQAHAVARQAYRAMLHHLAQDKQLLAGQQAAVFQNAAQLALMYEARQHRLFLVKILAELRGGRYVDEDTHELHAPAPDVPYDGFAVNGRRR